MIRLSTAAFVFVLAVGASGGEAKADPYRWCADYAYGGLGGAKNCYFLTLEQCRATVSGVGGNCTPNPFFTGYPVDQPRRSRPRQQ